MFFFSKKEKEKEKPMKDLTNKRRIWITKVVRKKNKRYKLQLRITFFFHSYVGEDKLQLHAARFVATCTYKSISSADVYSSES